MGDVSLQDVVTVAIIATTAMTNLPGALFIAATYVAGKLLVPNLPSSVTNARGRSVNVRSSIETRKLIYGEALIGGPIVYATTSGRRNQMLHLVIALADHECDSINTVYFNEDDSDSEVYHKLWSTSTNIWVADQGIGGGKGFDGYIRTYGNPNLNKIGDNNRGIFLDYSESDPDSTGHGYYYVTRTEETDVRNDFLRVDKVGGGPHEITAVGPEVKLYSSYRRINKHLGTIDQEADAELIADDKSMQWDSNCKLSGITYRVASLVFDVNKFPTGIPTITSVVKGKKVYDPREDPTIPGGDPLGTHDFYDQSTWEWSSNWALCVLDYLKDPTYGLDLDKDDIDWNSVISSANISDEDIQFNAGNTIVRKRYSINGVIDTGATVASNLETMLTAAEGKIAFTQGKYKIYAASYNAPSGDILDEKDLSGNMEIRASTPRSELFNVVSGIFIDKDQRYTATSFPRFPPTSAINIYVEEDKEEIIKEVELPFTTDIYQAQMLAKLILETSRQNITVTFPSNVKSLQYGIWDTVLVGSKTLGWGPIDSNPSNPYKEFRVIGLNIDTNGATTLTLKEESEDMYLWNLGSVSLRDSAPATGLPSPLYTIPPELGDADTSEIFIGSDGSIQSSIKIGWVDESPFTSYYEVEFKKSLDIDDDIPWESNGTTSRARTLIAPVSTGDTYFVRVRSVSNIGVLSDWATSGQIEVIGELAPPSAVQSFYIRVQSDGTREYIWTHDTKEIDVIGYQIKYIKQNDDAVSGPYDLQEVWNNNMIPLFDGLIENSPFEYNRPKKGDYIFAIAAVDASQIEGVPVEYWVSLPDPRTKNSIFDEDEALRETGFIGQKVNCNTVNRNLYPNLDPTGTSWTELADWTSIWHAGQTVSTFTYWTGNSDLTVSANSKLLAYDLGATINFSPNLEVETTGCTLSGFTIYYLSEVGAAWQSTSTLFETISARWIKVKLDFTVTDGKIAKVDDISITLTGDLIEEILSLDMATMRASLDYPELFPDTTNGHMILPYTKDYKVITNITISVVGSSAPTSFEIINKNLAISNGPEIQVWQWVTSTFVPTDLVIDAYIRGV